MTPERWKRIKNVLDVALERESGPERDSFLARECAGDQDLRREVESLLRADEQSGGLMDESLSGLAADLFGESRDEFREGQEIGPYRVEREIGRGGMGVVYLARDKRLDRPVALKLLPTSFSNDTNRVQRFRREARAISLLNHPAIVTVHEIGETDGHQFIVTEYVDGQTLRRLIDGGGMKLGQALDITMQVAGALSAAHEAGVVHRDVKPENVVVRPDGYVKVLDFGLAKLAERTATGDPNSSMESWKLSTQPGVVMGTVAYMSPEQARGKSVDARSDIFSLGVLFYELVTGKLPFSGETSSHTIVSILEQSPVAITEHVPDAPQKLQLIAAKALMKNSGDRYQTMSELQGELQELRETLTALQRSLPNGLLLSGDGVAARISTTASISKGSGRSSTSDNDGQSVTGQRGEQSRSVSSAEYLVGEVKRHKVVATMVVLIVLLIAGGLWFYGRRVIQSATPPISFENARFAQLSVTADYAAIISPDGRVVANMEITDESRIFWIKQLVSETRVQVAEFKDVEFWGWAFSPDSNFLYCTIGDDRSRGTLYRIPVFGGKPRKLLEGIAAFVSFSPDGKQMVYRRRTANSVDFEVVLADAEGESQRVIVSSNLTDEFKCVRYDWSRARNAVTCANHQKVGEQVLWNVSDIPLDGGPERIIMESRPQAITGLTWLPDGRGLIVVAEDETSGTSQLWLLSDRDGTLQRITRDTNDYYGVSITADGSKILTYQSALATSVWVGPASEPAGAQQIIPSPSEFERVTWVSEGQLALDGRRHVWTVAIAEGEAIQLTTNEGRNGHTCVTGDGRYLIYSSLRAGISNIWRTGVDGANAMQLTRDEGNLPSCSPDGKWALYSRNIANKESLWRVSINGGEPEQLDIQSDGMGVLSPDSKLIAYSFTDSSDRRVRLSVSPLDDNSQRRVINDGPFRGQMQWSRDGRGLYYISKSSGNLVYQPLSNEGSRTVIEHGKELLYSFSFSHDGKQLALVKGTKPTRLILISDFQNKE